MTQLSKRYAAWLQPFGTQSRRREPSEPQATVLSSLNAAESGRLTSQLTAIESRLSRP